MKKFTLILLAAVLLAAFAGCMMTESDHAPSIFGAWHNAKGPQPKIDWACAVHKNSVTEDEILKIGHVGENLIHMYKIQGFASSCEDCKEAAKKDSYDKNTGIRIDDEQPIIEINKGGSADDYDFELKTHETFHCKFVRNNVIYITSGGTEIGIYIR